MHLQFLPLSNAPTTASKWLAEALQGCKLLLHAGIASIGWHVSMVLEWQLDGVCGAVLGCSHLLLIVATASARAMLS